jgi:hypothetical protein
MLRFAHFPTNLHILSEWQWNLTGILDRLFGAFAFQASRPTLSAALLSQAHKK